MNMPFGKHRGKPVAELSQRYLGWLEQNVELYGELAAEVHHALHGGQLPKQQPASTFDDELAAIVGTFDNAATK